MAKLGTLRVSDVLDYERDIKGKRLVRLRAGVGAGKNYWARHLLEKHPDLQILLITSRKNTAQAEAFRLGTDCKIHTSKLIDIHDKDWYEDFPGDLMVCTNAYIEYFLKNIYRVDDPKTHLWNKFDLIFVDEVHSLTADASFANSPFAVERFIYHTLRMNHSCDIVAMSGTPESTDWLFTPEHWGTEYTDIDIYDTCVHLVPSNVYLFRRSIIAEKIHGLWSHGQRLVYFVNSVNGMAELVNELLRMGIPEANIGIAFTESDNADKLSPSLLDDKARIRKSLVEDKKLPSDIKIFITTSQNKEGISIEDDDIKYMFAESHNKCDLEQMAGRVRGNPDNGTGLRSLIVVYDANSHFTIANYVEQEFDRILVEHVSAVMDKHKLRVEGSNKAYNSQRDIDSIQKNHHYLRYDYIAKAFLFYEGRQQCFAKERDDKSEFDLLMEQLYDHLYYEFIGQGTMISVTGGYELWRSWFPYSQLYHSSNMGIGVIEQATDKMINFLRDKEYFDTKLDIAKQHEVMEYVNKLVQEYGQKELGFGRTIPATLKPALKHFNLEVSATSKHAKCDQIIHNPPVSE